MPAREVNHVSTSSAEKTAVDDLSLSVGRGEILGLIGPNGAGKTTTVRMMMDIIRPDRGEVTILGQESSAAIGKNQGYLPEERGVYRKLTVIDCIICLVRSSTGSCARSAPGTERTRCCLPSREG